MIERKDFFLFVENLLFGIGVFFDNFFTTAKAFLWPVDSISKKIILDTKIKPKICDINYKKYSTKLETYPLWVVKLFSKLPFKSPIISAIVLSLIVYSIGYVTAYAINFDNSYLYSIPVYLGSFGVGFVLYMIYYGSNKIHELYSKLRPCFFIGDDEYSFFIKNWIKRLFDNKNHIIGNAILSIVFILFAFLQFYNSEIFKYFGLGSIHPTFFYELHWFEQPDIFVKFLICAFYAVLVAFSLGTATRILFINFFFLLDLKSLPVVPIPNLIRNRLRQVTSFYIIISLSWFVGVSLFVALFLKNIDMMSIMIILISSTFGIITFIAPQIIYRALLTKSEDMANELVLTSFYKKFNIKINNSSNLEYSIYPCNVAQATDIDNLNFSDYFEITAPITRWIYNPFEVLLFISGLLSTIASLWLFYV